MRVASQDICVLQYTRMKTLCITCENPLLFEEMKINGADEVILPLKNGCFSPLCGFEESELYDLIAKAHSLDLSVSILMNRLFHEDDIDEALIQMKHLIEKGAGHIIFADSAFAYEAMKEGLLKYLVYQPETIVTSSFDAKVWSETGIDAVMISSLLTKDEVIAIAEAIENSGINIHGYQMMSVSARRLLSAYADTVGLGELKNRDHLYLVEEKRDGRMPVYENEYATMIFSDYIQESSAEMHDFIEAGMKRFVIESWHLSDACIFDTLRLYRAILDGKDDEAMISAYRNKYSDLPLSGGYYEQKTVR